MHCHIAVFANLQNITCWVVLNKWKRLNRSKMLSFYFIKHIYRFKNKSLHSGLKLTLRCDCITFFSDSYLCLSFALGALFLSQRDIVNFIFCLNLLALALHYYCMHASNSNLHPMLWVIYFVEISHIKLMHWIHNCALTLSSDYHSH